MAIYVRQVVRRFKAKHKPKSKFMTIQGDDMSKFWFTGDSHFDHENIIKYCNRPFSSANEMNEVMIKRWNEKVKTEDTVIHVGDFAFKRETHEKFLPRLNGKKLLIRGNHDPAEHKITDYWDKILSDVVELKLDGFNIVLCHYAMKVWNRSHHGALHFYGHSHGSLKPDSQSCDIGVDCWDFYPVDLKQIRKRLANFEARPDPFESLMEMGSIEKR